MLAAGLRGFLWQSPYCSFKIDISPSHICNFTAALGGQDEEPDKRPGRIPKRFACPPDFDELAHFQHAISILMVRPRLRNIKHRRVFDVASPLCPFEKPVQDNARST